MELSKKLQIPMVQLVLNGAPNSIRIASNSISVKIPIILFPETEGAAGLIANFINYLSTIPFQSR